MSKVLRRFPVRTFLAASFLLGGGIPAAQAIAPLTFTGGNSGFAFGVANYGGGGVPNPTYIADNFDNINDILTSPGHGFQTANTSIVNNIASYANVGNPAFAFQIGGSNGVGNFGTGITAIAGSNFQFALTDANPDGFGAASYEIGNWTSNYTVNGPLNTPYGNALGIAGHLTDSASAVAVSLRTHISDTAGVFGVGGSDLPQLVLAAAGTPNLQALGGTDGSTAGIFLAANGNFYGLAFNNLAAVALPNGDAITVTNTLTAIGDPMDLDLPFQFSDTLIPLDDLNADWGTGTDATSMLPGLLFSDGLSEVPEPATLTLLAAGATLMLSRRRRRV